MNKVTLYQVSKSGHMTYAGHIEVSSFDRDQLRHVSGSDEFIFKQEVQSVDIPIQKFVFSQKDWRTGEVTDNTVYAAFDDNLLQLIQCERSKFKDLSDSLVCKQAEISNLKVNVAKLESKVLYLEKEWLQSKNQIDKFKQMNFWKRLVYLFKGCVK